VALGLQPRLEQGAPPGALARSAMWRALRILVLGVAINVLAAWLLPHAHLRFPGVLQRIALCFAGVALFAVYTKPRTQWLAIATLLLGYWGLLLLGGSLEPWANIVSRVDSAVFGGLVYLIDPVTGRGHDPEACSARCRHWRAPCWVCAPVTGCAAKNSGSCFWPASRVCCSVRCGRCGCR
jgi:hypothetical protein